MKTLSFIISGEERGHRIQQNNIIVPKWKSIVVRNWNFNPFHGKSKTTEIWFSKSTVYIWESLKFLFWNRYFSKFVRNIGGAEWVGGIFGPKIFWFVLGGGAFYLTFTTTPSLKTAIFFKTYSKKHFSAFLSSSKSASFCFVI